MADSHEHFPHKERLLIHMIALILDAEAKPDDLLGDPVCRGEARRRHEKGSPDGEPFEVVDWRRGRDLNPRYTFMHTRFPGEPVQPLRHLSKGILQSVNRTLAGMGDDARRKLVKILVMELRLF